MENQTTKKIDWPDDIYWPSEFKSYIESTEFQKKWGVIFTQPQWEVLIEILKMLDMTMTYHSTKDDEAHPEFKELNEKIEGVSAKLRNHRHNLNESYSAKPEF